VISSELGKEYSYGGKILVVTKPTYKEKIFTPEGIQCLIEPGTFNKEIIVTIDPEPESSKIKVANKNLPRHLHQSNALKEAVCEVKACTFKVSEKEVIEVLEYILPDKTLEKPISITIPYNDRIKDSLLTKEENLRVFYLNEEKGKWEMVEDIDQILNKEKMCVTAKVKKFGIYTLLEVAEYGTTIGYYPVPARYPHDKEVVFINMEKVKSVRIYDRAGRLIRNLVNSGRYKLKWDLKNDKESIVASGVYFFVAEIPGKKPYVGKLLVIK
jgi:hypothetical protein